MEKQINMFFHRKRIKINGEDYMLFYFDRFADRTYKKIVILFLLFFPMLEIIWNEYVVLVLINGESMYSPFYMTFLAGSSVMVQKIFQIVYLWVLPIYLLIVACDDIAVDFVADYRIALISRLGKKQYFLKSLLTSFLVGFGLIFSGLMMNLLQVGVLFRGGNYSRFDVAGEKGKTFFSFSLHHPLITNLIYILLFSVLAGMVSAAGCSLLFVMKERAKVYPLIIALWIFAVLWDPSLMESIQPFNYEHVGDALPAYLIAFGMYFIIVLIGVGKEIWFGKKQIS